MGESPPFQEDYMRVKASTRRVRLQVGKGLIDDGAPCYDIDQQNGTSVGVMRPHAWGLPDNIYGKFKASAGFRQGRGRRIPPWP